MRKAKQAYEPMRMVVVSCERRAPCGAKAIDTIALGTANYREQARLSRFSASSRLRNVPWNVLKGGRQLGLPFDTDGKIGV